MSWFAYTTLWTLSLAGTTWVLAEDPLTRLLLLIGLFLIYIGVLALGSAFPQMNFYFTSLNRGPADQGCVALTFDDGPDPKVMPKLLALLEKEEVEVTFFMIGQAAEANPALVKRAESKGHLIANHSYYHSSTWPFQFVFAIRDELARASEILAKLIGNKPKYVRMPFSVGRPGLNRAFRKLKLTPVGWDVRGLEGLYRDPKLIAEHVAKEARNGSVILLHECYYRTADFGPDRVVETVRQVIAKLRERGFKFQRLDDMFETEGYNNEA
jgi:peptidoglycan/xylan/chitin deacetylase (PgdA/CDA1 family)